MKRSTADVFNGVGLNEQRRQKRRLVVNEQRRADYAVDEDRRVAINEQRRADYAAKKIQARSEQQIQARSEQQEEKITADFSTSIVQLKDPSKLNFSSFEQNVETALVLFHLNRGGLQYSLEEIGMPEGNEKIRKEIQNELLEEAEIEEKVKRFKNNLDPCMPIKTCGACGITELCQMDTGDLGIRRVR